MSSTPGPTSDNGWRESTRWPTLKTSRSEQPGCAKIGRKVIITGGKSGRDYQRSTEVLDLTSHTLSIGGDMATARIHFKLATLKISGQDRVLALGGLICLPGGQTCTYLDSVEEWVEETSTWKETESLSRTMRYYGVATVRADLICPK